MKKPVLRFLSWICHGRHYHAPLRPFRLLWIDPDRIERYPKQTPELRRWMPTGVISGEWDQRLQRFENGVTYRSFRRRFIEGDDWTSTPYYQFALDRIETTGSFKGFTTPEGVLERCDELDYLYKDIFEHGYQTQQEIDTRQTTVVHRHSHLPPEMREVTVDVARSGELLWWGGAHRLAIAKLLQLESIPVRIRVRHEGWQRQRDSVFKNGQSTSDHPDLPT